MQEQLSLFDGAGEEGGVAELPADACRHNLLLALVPPARQQPAVAAAARSVARRAGVDCRFLDADRLHVSLFLFGTSERQVPRHLVRAVDRAARRLGEHAFDLGFDSAASFASAQAFVLMGSSANRLDALRDFRRALGIALADTGLDIRATAFEPHLTVGYGGRVVPRRSIEPIGWRVHELVLIDSRLGAHVHAVLGRWPLAPEQPRARRCALRR